MFLIGSCGNVCAENNQRRCGTKPEQIPSQNVCPELASSCFVVFDVSINLSWNESFYWCIKQSLELVWVKSEAEARWLLNKTYELKRSNSEIDGVYINLRESSYCSEGRTWCWPNGDVQDTNKKVSDVNPFAWLAGKPDAPPGSGYDCAHLWFDSHGHLGIDDLKCRRKCDQYEYHPIVICRMKMNRTGISIISTATTSGNNENASKYLPWRLILFCTLLGIILIGMLILGLIAIMGKKSEKPDELRMSQISLSQTSRADVNNDAHSFVSPAHLSPTQLPAPITERNPPNVYQEQTSYETPYGIAENNFNDVSSAQFAPEYPPHEENYQDADIDELGNQGLYSLCA